MISRTCEYCEHGEAVPLPKECAPCIIHIRDNFRPKLRVVKDRPKDRPKFDLNSGEPTFNKPWSRINGVYRIG